MKKLNSSGLNFVFLVTLILAILHFTGYTEWGWQHLLYPFLILLFAYGIAGLLSVLR